MNMSLAQKKDSFGEVDSAENIKNPFMYGGPSVQQLQSGALSPAKSMQ